MEVPPGVISAPGVAPPRTTGSVWLTESQLVGGDPKRSPCRAARTATFPTAGDQEVAAERADRRALDAEAVDAVDTDQNVAAT